MREWAREIWMPRFVSRTWPYSALWLNSPGKGVMSSSPSPSFTVNLIITVIPKRAVISVFTKHVHVNSLVHSMQMPFSNPSFDCERTIGWMRHHHHERVKVNLSCELLLYITQYANVSGNNLRISACQRRSFDTRQLRMSCLRAQADREQWVDNVGQVIKCRNRWEYNIIISGDGYVCRAGYCPWGKGWVSCHTQYRQRAFECVVSRAGGRS